MRAGRIFAIAVYHLIAHGLFKATLFLGSGNVISESRHEDGVPPDDIYSFVVERRPLREVKKVPWLLAALVTVLVPALVLGLSHGVVAEDFFHKQGSVVLLFFGWVTGAQLFFSIHKLPSENAWGLLTMILLSFFIVVVGYTLIAHAFEAFLYPDPVLRDAIYAAAGINDLAFGILVLFFTALLVGAWLVTFYAQSLEIGGKPGTRVERCLPQSLRPVLARVLCVRHLHPTVTRPAGRDQAGEYLAALGLTAMIALLLALILLPLFPLSMLFNAGLQALPVWLRAPVLVAFPIAGVLLLTGRPRHPSNT